MLQVLGRTASFIFGTGAVPRLCRSAYTVRIVTDEPVIYLPVIKINSSRTLPWFISFSILAPIVTSAMT